MRDARFVTLQAPRRGAFLPPRGPEGPPGSPMGPEALRAGGLGKHGARAARPRGALLERSGSGLAVFGEAGSR